MSKKSSKNKKMYTLPIEYAHEVIDECIEQIDASNDLLEYFYDIGIDIPENLRALPHVVELLWLNYSIRDILAQEMSDDMIQVHEETGQEEYIMTEESIYQLQALLLSRYHSNMSLSKISYSVSVH